MNIEEIDKWLDREYGVSYTSLERIHDWLCDKEIEKDKEIERLKRQIKIKDEWCHRIWEVGYDYDGYENDLEGLKGIVDELVAYSNYAIKCDDKTVAYISYENGKEIKENILMERIGCDKE